MTTTSTTPQLTTSLHLPGAWRRRIAASLLQSSPLHLRPSSFTPPEEQIRVVCIADTHNNEPELPNGDILIHAGDLTKDGAFNEIQKQLDWLATQPHAHKFVIAGNHDVLLDEHFLQIHSERKYGDPRTLKDLNWHDLIYLEESSVSIEVYPSGYEADELSGYQERRPRVIKVYGSPYTPRYGISAFQRPPDEDSWTEKLDRDIDIVITHGPPHLHLDKQGIHDAGDPYLAHEIARTRPRLVVFGHIHISHGREDVLFDKTLLLHDDILRDWAGYLGLAQLALRVLWTKLRCALLGKQQLLKHQQVTTLVNAAHGRAKYEPIVVTI